MNAERFKGKYRIQSIRLPAWDYASSGWYFVTICTANRLPLFGAVVDGVMHRSPVGDIAHHLWQDIPKHFPHAKLDEFIIMPNHLHGIIVIQPGSGVGHTPEEMSPVETQHAASLQETSVNVAPLPGRFGPMRVGSISKIVQAYKAAVTREARRNGYDAFSWQSRFYEHIIRSDGPLDRIRNYIFYNALKRDADEYYVSNPKGP